MTLATVFLVAIALGTDAFSMAIGIGLTGIRWRRIALISGVVSLFHIFMPLTGLFLGSLLGRAVGQIASYIGAVVLLFIGLQMLREGFGEAGSMFKVGPARKSAAPGSAPTLQVYSGVWALLVLAGSVSLDALTVGFGLGTLQANLTLTVLIMGLVAGLMTAAGFILGNNMGSWLGEKAQIVGGIILIIIGIRMFF